MSVISSKTKTSPFNKLKTPPVDGSRILKFSLTNAKISGEGDTAAFSLPAGYTCPGACECLSWFDRDVNKIIDGSKTEYRCFAASAEASFSSVRKSVDRNLAILKEAKTTSKMAEVINYSLPPKVYKWIRVHVDGDFYSSSYFLAWMKVANMNPERMFYAYTKSLPIWMKNRDKVPKNFVITASRGGKWDAMIEGNNLRSAHVVYHPEEAAEMGLEIDHDDSHAKRADGKDFALLIHGTQPTGSKGQAAQKRMRQEGIKYSYSKNKNKS